MKGYLISLGGNLNILKSGVDSSGEQAEGISIFDQIIHKQFNEHLEVTLAYNQSLYEKYPYYANMIRSLPYDEPDLDLIDDDQTLSPHYISNVYKQMAKSKDHDKFFV